MIANSPAAWDVRAAAPTSWEAALWSKMGQVKRFKAIRRNVSMESGETVLDFGCGTGELRNELFRRYYFGYDWSPAMRERARRIPGGTILDELGDRRFDHVVCVGTFNLADQWSKDETGMTMLDLWMRHTDKSLAVSLYRGLDPDCLSYSPIEAGIWANRLTNRWKIDTSYLDNDFLLVMYK